jgi:GNAT superfamily N-acetyltransferase
LQISIVTTADRPDLAPAVARWLWEAFWRHDGYSFDETLAAAIETVRAKTMPRTFVLLADHEPVGTASLAPDDLDERPDLTPWLAGVFVAPHVRGRGYATRLVITVEQEARAASFPRLWLYTLAAEGFYARLGWQTVEMIRHRARRFALMRQDLCNPT